MREIEEYLPQGWAEKARETGAFSRGRVIKSPSDLLALNMLYITGESSFSITAAAMTLTKGVKISKVGVYDRVKNSGEWLRWMASELCKTQGAMLQKPKFIGEREVIIPDGSDEPVKGSKRTEYRLHYALDLFNFSNRHMELTTEKAGEKLTRYEIREKDIFVADRIYCTIQGIEHVLGNNGNFVLRFKSKAFHLYDESGEKIDLLPRLRELKSLENKDVNAFYRINGAMRSIRIVAMKKDAKAIADCKRKMARKSSKKQEKKATKETLELNEYIVLATSLDYTNEQILELYRARWQIEMVFRRLKTIFGYGDVPSKRPETARAWFYGKLFLAALCESIMKQASFSPELDRFIVNMVGAKLVE